MDFRPIDVIRNFTIHLPIDRLSADTLHRPRVVLRFGLDRANKSPGGRGADRAGIFQDYEIENGSRKITGVELIISGGRGADRAGICIIVF